MSKSNLEKAVHGAVSDEIEAAEALSSLDAHSTYLADIAILKYD
jgi:hypothetical protein